MSLGIASSRGLLHRHAVRHSGSSTEPSSQQIRGSQSGKMSSPDGAGDAASPVDGAPKEKSKKELEKEAAKAAKLAKFEAKEAARKAAEAAKATKGPEAEAAKPKKAAKETKEADEVFVDNTTPGEKKGGLFH